MKTKRALLSIVVFFSVYWISILIGFSYSSPKFASEIINTSILADNTDSQAIYESKLSSNRNLNIASISDSIYQSDNTDITGNSGNIVITDNTDNTDINDNSGNTDNPDNNTQTSTQNSQNEANTQDKTADSTDMSMISARQSDVTPRETLISEEAITLEEELIQEAEIMALPSIYSHIGISIAKSYVNIRSQASTESEIEGKLYKDSAAKILDSTGDWYYVESGSVKGYIMKDYLKTNIPDDELIEKYGTLRISVNTDGLNVRENPDIDSKKLTVIYKNEVYSVIELYDEWVKVDISDDKIIGYVSKEYIELIVDFTKAISKEEEEELKKLQEEERIKKETEIKYRDELDYTQEELKLLACLVHAEAGNQSYEGKLAVANVVLNRVKSSKYPNTIEEVIYQPGQFTVSSSGSLDKQLDNYNNYSSNSQRLTIKAAKAALSGANNIGSRLYFNSYKSAVKKGYDQKKNCVKIEDHLFW